MRFLVHLLITAAALWAAAVFVPGIHAGGFGSLLLAALVFGFVNALIRPVFRLLSCPVIILTLGLFTFVINALMLMLTGWFSRIFGIGFRVDGFVAAFLGALVVAIVSTVLSWILMPPKEST
jgi:putative membrane protein